MKNLLILLGFISILFVSCSEVEPVDPVLLGNQYTGNNNNNNNNGNNNGGNTTNPILLTKMVLTSPDEDSDTFWNSTVNITYNGNKIIQQIDEDNYKLVYHYTGDLITKVEYYYDGVFDGKDEFSYDSSGRLIEYNEFDDQNVIFAKFIFTYSSNNTAICEEYQVDSNNNLYLFTTSIYTFLNGELSSIDYGGGEIYSYSYDNKNNPFKNVLGYNKIMIPEYTDDYQIVFGRNQNVTSRSLSTDSTYDINSIYNYNSYDFPISSVTNTNFGSSSTNTVNVQYFYNQ